MAKKYSKSSWSAVVLKSGSTGFLQDWLQSFAVLTEDERELGVCVVDMGGGTMDIAIYTGGALRHTRVIPYAGNVVTSDIAYAFGTPPNDAEAIKVRHGCALGSLVGKDENVEVPSVGR